MHCRRKASPGKNNTHAPVRTQDSDVGAQELELWRGLHMIKILYQEVIVRDEGLLQAMSTACLYTCYAHMPTHVLRTKAAPGSV